MIPLKFFMVKQFTVWVRTLQSPRQAFAGRTGHAHILRETGIGHHFSHKRIESQARPKMLA
jgi:hypothetical protein